MTMRDRVTDIGGDPGSVQGQMAAMDERLNKLEGGGGNGGGSDMSRTMSTIITSVALVGTLLGIVGFGMYYTDKVVAASTEVMAARFDALDKISNERFEKVLTESRLQTQLMVQEIRHEIELKEARLDK